MIDHKNILPLIHREISGLCDMPHSEKEKTYQVIKEYINQKTEGLLRPVDSLRKYGCISLGSLLDVQKLKKELLMLPIYKGHIKNDLYSDHIPITDYTEFKLPHPGIYCWSMKDLLQNKTITDIASSPLIIDFVSNYLGCLPTCYGINCMLSHGTSRHGTTSRHRDLDDFKFLSVFIYLTDVDLTCGPHLYELGTHLGNPNGRHGNELPDTPREKKIFTGIAGEGFVEDNWGVHHGLTISPGKSRICLWIRYGLYDNYTSRHSVEFEKHRTDRHTFDMENEANKYVFRFLV